jgi:hypothetical protein
MGLRPIPSAGIKESLWKGFDTEINRRMKKGKGFDTEINRMMKKASVNMTIEAAYGTNALPTFRF